METLPNELLVNVFGRLNFKDVGNCRLVNRRFDELIMKYVYKPRCKLEICTPSDKAYNVTLRSREEHEFVSCFQIHVNEIKVNYKNDDEFARLVAKRLGAPDPVSDPFSDAQVVQYSGMREALKIIVQVAQLKHTIDTLEQNSKVDEDILDCIVSQIPKDSVRHLIVVKPQTSDDVLHVINQIGLEGIRYIRIHDAWNVTHSTHMMDSLMPEIPRINLNTGPYRVSFSLVKTVIENWLHSDWVISLCSFKVSGVFVWDPFVELLLNAEVLSTVRKSSETTEVFRLTRDTDGHILNLMIKCPNGMAMQICYPEEIKLYENEKYKDKHCIL